MKGNCKKFSLQLLVAFGLMLAVSPGTTSAARDMLQKGCEDAFAPIEVQATTVNP